MTPESDEVHTYPAASTAARKVPSLLEVIDFQKRFDDLVCFVQLTPELDEVQILPPRGVKLLLMPDEVASTAASRVPSLLEVIAVQRLFPGDRLVQLAPKSTEVQMRPPNGTPNWLPPEFDSIAANFELSLFDAMATHAWLGDSLIRVQVGVAEAEVMGATANDVAIRVVEIRVDKNFFIVALI